MRQVQLLGHCHHPVGSAIPIAVREGQNLPLPRDRDEKISPRAPRHKASGAEARGEDFDPEAGWQDNAPLPVRRRRNAGEQYEQGRSSNDSPQAPALLSPFRDATDDIRPALLITL